MNDNFWVQFFAFWTFAVTQYFIYKKCVAAGNAATTAGQNAVAASGVNNKAIKKVSTELEMVKEELVEVKKNTNGLTSKLVEETEKEALARGAAEERARMERAREIE